MPTRLRRAAKKEVEEHPRVYDQTDDKENEQPDSNAATNTADTVDPTEDSTPDEARKQMLPIGEADSGGKKEGALNMTQVGKDIDNVVQQVAPETPPKRSAPALYEPMAKKKKTGKGDFKRLVIRDIVLENFKSYGGRKHIGNFSNNFSVIVGPNGSGKSNIIDAMLFVFGKKAKQIRQNKLSELIHNAGGERPDRARVKISFAEVNNEDGQEIAGSAFTISRECYSNSSSKYAIDDRTSSWTEVGDRLRGYGIDLDHNRFLILQGEVESIAMMKPKGESSQPGFLEFLEEIIGSEVFISDIEESSDEMNRLVEERNLHLNRVNAAHKDVVALEGPKREAMKYVKVQCKLIGAKAKLVQYNRGKADKRRQEAEIERKEAAEELKEMMEEIEQANQKVKEAEGECKKEEKACGKITAKADKLKRKYDELDRQYTKAKEDLKTRENKIKKTNKEITTNENKAEKLQDDAKEMEEVELPKLESEIKKLEEKNEVERKKLEEIYGKEAKCSTKSKEAHDSLTKDLTELREAQANYARDINDMMKQKKHITDKVSAAQGQRARIENEKQIMVDKLHQREDAIEESKKVFEQYSARIRQNEERIVEIHDALAQNGAEGTDLLNKIDHTQVKMQESGGSQGAPNLRRVIMQASKSGQLKGVYGRLGDLGTVDEMYDVAACTAAGQRLDHIVVDNTECAQAVIEFCKKRKLGRVSCIILDQIKEPRWNGNPPEDTKRLIDLIKPNEPKFRAGFIFGVNDTLVAKDLSQAQRVGHGEASGGRRYRVVTLDGKLVETSGVMSAGGRVQKGLFGAQRGKDPESGSYQKLEQQVNRLKQKLEELKTARTQLTNERLELQDMNRQMKATLADHEQRQLQPIDLDAIKLSIQQFDQQLAAVVCPELSDGEKKTVADLDEKIEEKQGELNEIQGGVKSLMDAIQKLKDTILRSEGDRTRAQKQKMELLKKTLEEKRVEKRRLTVRIRKARENAEKALKEAEHLRKDIESLKNEEEKHRAETEKLEPVVLEIMAEYTQLLNEKKEHEDELEKLKENVKKIRDEHQEVKKKEEDLKINYEEKSNKVRQHEEASRHHSKELATLKKEWNDLPTALLFEELEHDSASPNPPQATQRGTPSPSSSRRGASPSLPKETPEQTPERVKEPDEEDAVMSEHEADNDDLRILGRAVLVDLSEEELTAVEKALSSIKSMVFALEDEIQKMQPNTRAIEDYKKKAADYKKKKDELDAVTKERDDVRNKLKQLENDRLTMFLTGFHTIREKLKELYQMITLGGDADLELVDGQDPFSLGISFSVRPPRKSWKQIANLSGGEKTLASLALVFALHYYKPTPLYFMDEIDAALDQRNVAIIANYIKERTQNAQFIIITLRNSMFELADLLVGICKTNDRSKSIMVDPAKYTRRDSLASSSTPILPVRR